MVACSTCFINWRPYSNRVSTFTYTALIMADEPTGNLDPETSDEIMQLLFQIAKDYNTAVIMATHDYIVINRYPARMLKTERGHVYDSATVAVSEHQ